MVVEEWNDANKLNDNDDESTAQNPFYEGFKFGYAALI